MSPTQKAEQSLFHNPDEDISGDVHVGHTHYFSKTHAYTHTQMFSSKILSILIKFERFII